MKKKMLCAGACLLSMISTAAMADMVTPEQVRALPVGTVYKASGGTATLTKTKDGFSYNSPFATNLPCNNVTKAGNVGNATINCSDSAKHSYRFGWSTITKIDAVVWQNVAARAGQKQDQVGMASAVFMKQ